MSQSLRARCTATDLGENAHARRHDESFGASCTVALAYIASHAERTRLEYLLLGRAAIRYCGHPLELTWEASKIVADAVAICEVPAPTRQVMLGLQQFRRRFPGIPLMLLSQRGGPLTQDAMVLAAATGADRTVIQGMHDVGWEVNALLDQAAESGVGGRILGALDRARPRCDKTIREFVAAVAKCTRDMSTVGGVAQQLGLSLRTLERRLRSAEMPSAHVLFWSILVYRVASLLQDPQSTVERVAALLPFSDRCAVSTRFRRYACISPTEARRPGALGVILERFEAMLDLGGLDAACPDAAL
ncbi:MAG: helix-turn-helix domain-containing protein [Gemmatimonadaceae bacterium]